MEAEEPVMGVQQRTLALCASNVLMSPLVNHHCGGGYSLVGRMQALRVGP